MKNLLPATLKLLDRISTLSGRPVEFKPDSSLPVRATLQLARHGAPAHLLRYRATNEPLDYYVAYQAGYALRLFELPTVDRVDLRGTGQAERQVDALLRAGQPLDAADKEALPRYTQIVAHWSLMNLRSFPIGLRIDQWLAREHLELRELQLAGIEDIQQENLQVLSRRLGNLSVPTTLLGPLAACALVADRIRGTESYAIPYPPCRGQWHSTARTSDTLTRAVAGRARLVATVRPKAGSLNTRERPLAQSATPMVLSCAGPPATRRTEEWRRTPRIMASLGPMRTCRSSVN